MALEKSRPWMTPWNVRKMDSGPTGLLFTVDRDADQSAVTLLDLVERRQYLRFDLLDDRRQIQPVLELILLDESQPVCRRPGGRLRRVGLLDSIAQGGEHFILDTAALLLQFLDGVVVA